MFSINMGVRDILLGDKWLTTLGSVAMDFKELYMSSVKDSHTHILQGIKASPLEIISSYHMEKILKKGNSSIIAQLHAI